MAQIVGEFALAIVVGVWLVGTFVQFGGHAIHQDVLVRRGGLMRGLAIGIGLPAAGAVVIAATGWGLLPNPSGLVLLGLAALPVAGAVLGYRVVRRLGMQGPVPSRDIH